MSQYQMAPRNATIRRIYLSLMLAWGLCALLWPLPTAKAGPHPQNAAPPPSHLFLLPLGETPIEILTHTLDAAVSVDGERALRMDIRAAYRLHNPKTTESTLLLQVDAPPSPNPDQLRLPDALALESDGQPLLLQPTGNGLQQTTQISFGPDQRRTLLLTYTLRFPAADLPAFVYPAHLLSAWPGRLGSWRVTLTIADPGTGALAPDNWLSVEPEGWTYTGSRLQWLSEEPPPKSAIRWQVLHPALWQEIQNRRQIIRQQPAPTTFLELGDIYRALYTSATDESDTAAGDREQFYAHALGAYTDGLAAAQQSSAPAAEIARLHHALAALYRSRSIGADGQLDPAYVQLMVEEAEAALALLPDEAPALRSEATGWLADGLRQQARQARQRQAWPAAIALIDRLAALPDSPVDAAALAEERRLLLLEQALQFLDQNNPEAALALAGPTLSLDNLLPPAEQQAIFARWSFTLTLQPGAPVLSGSAPALPGREEEARRATEQLALAWQTVRPAAGTAQATFDGKQTTIAIAGLPLSDQLALIQATPQNTHWALLRTLLVNTEAEVTRTPRLVWQVTTIRHSLDLRPVADQWRGIAAGLERESLAAQTTASADQRVQGELRAITYRQEAARWHKLAQESRVNVVLRPSPQPAEDPSRVWSLALSDAPQPLTLFAESVSFVRLLMGLALAMALIFVLAGILWLLL